MNEIIGFLKKYRYALVLAGLVVGFFAGRATIQDETVVKYENGKTVSDTIYSEKLVSYATNKPAAPVLPMKHDTLWVDSVSHDIFVVDTAKIIATYIEKRSYKNTLFDNDINGKLTVSSDVQYNALVKLGYEFTPIQKNTTITRTKIIVPWLEIGYNSFGYISAGGGIYYHNLGVGARYETDFTKKGFSLGMHYKF